MDSKLKVCIKFCAVLFVAIMMFTLSFFVIETQFYSLRAAGQGPTKENMSSAFTKSQLQDHGLDVAAIDAANSLPYDLKIVKTTDVTQVNAGDSVSFEITISNEGSNPVSYALFHDDYPTQLQNVSYLFDTTAISNGQAKPTWLLPDPIDPGGTVQVSVNGILTSVHNTTVQNTATIDAFDNTGETNTQNNNSSVTIGIDGVLTEPITYTAFFPIIFKPPPPPKVILVYSENFDDDNDWIEFSTNDCDADNRDNQYWVEVKREDEECLPFAPDEPKPEVPQRTYGEFEVTAYHSEDLSGGTSELSDAKYGLFINGQGGDNQYIFRISPNNNCSSGGDWQLIRKKNDSSTVLREGVCNTAIKRGGNRNTLRIAHGQDRVIIVYANGVELGRSDPETTSNELRGKATGVYVRSDDEDVRMKFDDFKVFKYE